ncbi:hypothetical protein RESH_03386 [Rhodopirellula europaea SH398]|uniref:Uncharacterized protein n=1 Tax=Rhodopirellula europaea SH398 TaxID=1263868 RepID=M5SIL5_9BACT|nr:hypothetical protein RESH_03386 [Rhodopirellula europaea SH398]
MTDTTFIWVVFYKKPIAPTGFTSCIHEPFTIPTRKLRNSLEERFLFLNDLPATKLVILTEKKLATVSR